MRFFIIVFFVLFSFFSCKLESKHTIDVSNINANLSIDRYEVDFYSASKDSLKNLKNKYPYLFPVEFTDSIALAKISNKDEQELFLESQKIYKNISNLDSQLTSLFKYVKYYNPKFRSPKVVTMLSNIDYENRVIYADSLLFISLDSYLGSKHKFYADYPKYIKQNNTDKNIIIDVANSIINKQLLSISNRSFISKIIYEGKKMYLLDMYVNGVSDSIKIGYSEEKMQWATYNEEDIWKYFIERKLLFSTDTKLNKRFIDNAPFSKFYLENDSDSPGRIGVWLGWQIVRSFMQNNDVSLQELLIIDSEELFNKSKYKPKK
ncbi:gliding motility lipoprotein GldB [uncultured Polaribacter sp.]|uniref:gliding motility lipoprotein GldB n=1 Tax=uncultured Polaribacter sp. TaxID=174711 RepID=UPI002628BA9C|nr:gliding motility lipoprotein GldB [uncultured Polaribacter sp.]